MKLSHRFTARKNRLFVAAALGGTALALCAPMTIAAIVDSGVVNIPVPPTIDGIYMNLVTGAMGSTGGSVSGWDINPFASGTNLAFFTQAANGNQNLGAGTIATGVAPGTTIGPASAYANVGANQTTGTAFRNTGVAYLGFKFMNEGTSTTNYGYALMSTTSTFGFPATIVRYVYDNSGAAITIPVTTGLFRAYLDPAGSDANPCTLAAPCRLLPAAIAAVADGGEVWMLDSANYNTGMVIINKSVTILAVPGALGSFVATGGAPALLINAPAGRVALRNAVVIPLVGGGGTNGIEVTAAAGLTLENCLVAGVPARGISVGAATTVSIADSTIRDNGGDGLYLTSGSRTTVARTRVSGNANTGIYLQGSLPGTTTQLNVGDSTIDANQFGIYVQSVNATAVVGASIRDSQVVRQPADGLTAESVAGATVSMAASGNVVSNNGTGLRAFQAGARIWASGNTVSENGLGFNNDSGALFESASDNALNDNGAPTAGAMTPVGKI